MALDLTEEWDALQADSETPSTLVTGVVVARTTFVEEHPEVVSAFLDHYQESVDYVNSNVEEAAQLVGQYEIVTAEVAQKALPECNIVFIEGDEMKEKLSGYLSVLFEQNPQSVGGALPDDASTSAADFHERAAEPYGPGLYSSGCSCGRRVPWPLISASSWSPRSLCLRG